MRMNGAAATQQIKDARPHVRVIGLSMHDEAFLEAEMTRAGAEQNVCKDAPPEKLIEAIRGRGCVS